MADEVMESSNDGDVLSAWANEPDPEPEEKAGEGESPDAPPGAMAGDRPEPSSKPAKPAAEAKGEGEPEKPEAAKEKPAKRTYRQKVNGRDEELDAEEVDRLASRLGLPAQELLSATSLQRAAYERMQEAAKLRREAEQAIEILRKDPFEAAKRAGLDEAKLEELVQRRALELYQREFDPQTGKPLTPEQRQALDWRSRAEAADRDKEEREKADRTREEEQAAEEMRGRWVRTIVGKLEQAKLPKSMTARVAAHMADLIGADRSVNPEDVVDDAAELAAQDLEQESATIFGDMPWEQFRGKHPALVEKVRAGLLADFRARKGAKTPAPGKVDSVPVEKRSEKGPRTITDINGFLKGWARGA